MMLTQTTKNVWRSLVLGLFVTSCHTVPVDNSGGPQWTFIPTPDEVGARAHSPCAAGDDFFVAFGGIEEGRGSPLGHGLVIYDDKQKKWQLNFEAEGPTPRNFTALALLDKKVYIVGGETKESQATSDVYVYSLREGNWTRLPVPPELMPRKQASVTAVGPELIIFGGKGPSERLNWARYNPEEARWSVHALPSDMKSRVSHVALGLDNSRLFVWGGFEGPERRGDGFTLDGKTQALVRMPLDPALSLRGPMKALPFTDSLILWGGAGAIVNRKSLAWSRLPPHPEPRFAALKGAEIAPLGDQGFLLFGGRFGTEGFNDQVWFFDRHKHIWSLLRTDENPPGRMAHCFVALGPRKFAVFGGIGYEKGTESLTQFDGLWILDLKPSYQGHHDPELRP